MKINCPIFSVFAIVLAAAGELDWSKLPEAIGNSLGIGTFGGQMLLSMIVLLATVLPVLLLSKGKPLVALLVGTLVLAFLVAVGWMDPLVFTLLIFVTAVGWAKLLIDIVVGKGGDY